MITDPNQDETSATCLLLSNVPIDLVTVHAISSDPKNGRILVASRMPNLEFNPTFNATETIVDVGRSNCDAIFNSLQAQAIVIRFVVLDLAP